MNGLRTLLPLFFALCATTLAGCATSRSTPAEEWDGLVLRPGTRLNAIFVKPDADIVAYRNVLLDPVQVSFARDWDPNRGGRSSARRLNANDLTAIKTDVAELFRETFRAELARGGYLLVDEPGPDTLRVTAFIIDLYVTAPDTRAPGRTRTYTANSGRMTLVAELRDSETGEILARAVDSRRGRSTGTLNVTNSATNTADARRAMGIWATALREGMDEMYGRANQAAPSQAAPSQAAPSQAAP
jgi:hypothetical protein